MPRKDRSQSGGAGFTLIEVLVALALLGMTAVLLLDAHYGAMCLFTDTRDDVLMQGFLQRALGQAEVEVLAGSLNGSGTFGKRYPDYGYTYSAQTEQLKGGISIPLYTVTVSVTDPAGQSQTMTELVYNTSE